MKIAFVNADDFGMNRSRTIAIMECFEKGWIDTATLMCNDLENGCFEYAIHCVKNTQYVDRIGIHYCLTEGKPLTLAMKNNTYFCDENGKFKKFNRNKFLSRNNKKVLFNELCAQTDRFLSAGMLIHHIDSHHHIHTGLGMIGTFKKIMKKYNIKAIRISRNVYSKQNVVRRVGKLLFNHLFLKKSIRYSFFFCSLSDASTNVFKKKVEIMCHPDLNKEGKVIDNDTNNDGSVLIINQINAIKTI